nr:GNAT family N-acetyltransferase [Tianweitania aestuarii]
MPDGGEAELTLVKTSPTQWIATHTFVPPANRGGDLAAKLVDRLVADARQEGVKIRATCWYVAGAFKRHADEWEDVRA